MSKTLIEQRESVLKDIKKHDRTLQEAKKVLAHLQNADEPNNNRIKDMNKIINFLEKELMVKRLAFKLADIQTGIEG